MKRRWEYYFSYHHVKRLDKKQLKGGDAGLGSIDGLGDRGPVSPNVRNEWQLLAYLLEHGKQRVTDAGMHLVFPFCLFLFLA